MITGIVKHKKELYAFISIGAEEDDLDDIFLHVSDAPRLFPILQIGDKVTFTPVLNFRDGKVKGEKATDVNFAV